MKFQKKDINNTTDDRTPLIVPTEPQQVYTTGAIDENNENEVEGIPPLSASQYSNSGYSRRRLSIFATSVRSSSKKDDYIKEKANFTKWLNEQLMKVDDFILKRNKMCMNDSCSYKINYINFEIKRLNLSKRKIFMTTKPSS